MLHSASAQIFTNLQAFGSRLKAGDPTVRATNSLDGPKGIANADFNGDTRSDLAIANTDGTVTVFLGRDEGRFGPPIHLQTGEQELRGIVAGDLTGDGRPDIAVAAPYASKVFLFINQGGGFGDPAGLDVWPGARNLTAGDFDGDGRLDLAVAGTTNGVQQLRSLGGGNFASVTNLPALAWPHPDFPKPVYALSAFRPAGSTRDELVATHAEANLVWVLGADSSGALSTQGTITNQRVHALAVGPLTRPNASGALDVVTASRDLGWIEVHRGIAGPGRFEQVAAQRMQVPGGPRALQIADLNADGWNDLVVVLRNFDRVLTYHNSNGVLVAESEMPVGRSPREVVAARFNADPHPDVAVMNRDSSDVSVLLTHPGQSNFSALDQLYPVDGEVSGLVLYDFNRDGRDDVVQLHRASAEFSVRLAGTNGLLGEPRFFPMGSLPSAQAAVDVNGDGIADMVTANLGQSGLGGGSVSVRLGDGMGGFGEEQRYYLPADAPGNLFALVAADFDKDGDVDLASGFFDCRLAFFENLGGGNFKFTKAHFFTYEARVMVTGDFDQDGDIDLAGAGYAGDVVVIENTGDLLHDETLQRKAYPPSSPKKFGTRDIVTADVNGDGDLDLLVGSGNGTMLFLGAEGMDFFRTSEKLPGTDFPASAVTLGDFDGDGSRDVAVACRLLSCITILTRGTNDGEYQPVVSVDVPSGEFLASGDLDGDGFADLVGSGSVLWTALSSRRAQPKPASFTAASRQGVGHPVINELLAINNDVPVEQDGERTSDWVELFNDGAQSVVLNGWRLRLTAREGGITTTNVFAFPATAFFPTRGRLLVIFSENRRTLYHTGFRLPGEGGVLTLLNASGVEVDRVEFPAQQANVSYARYRDGLPAFTFNPYPSAGRENTDNGSVEPAVSMNDATLTGLRPDEPIRFEATGRDDVGIISLSLVWQRLDMADNETHRVILYDDGMHDDGGVLDGRFAGMLQPGLPSGAEIQFYLEAVDLSGQTIIEPDEAIFARSGQRVTLYSLAIDPTRSPLEISEVVPDNENGLRDELGGTPDWVEVRNCSESPVSLRGVTLAQGFFGNRSRYVFNDADVLQPGEQRVIYCDNLPARGALHAPFALDRAGDRVVLTGVAPAGARALIDSTTFEAQALDRAWARLGCGGAWRSLTPTPRAANVPGAWLGFVSDGGLSFTLAFPTTTNRSYVVERTDSLNPPSWSAMPPMRGDGIEKVVTQPLAPRRFFRVKATNE
jgi:hypothetical protein